MPAVSRAQQNLMAAAEHGASFPMADKLRQTMSHDQLHDFAVGSQQGKPEHVLQGHSVDIQAANTQAYKNRGFSELDATKQAIRHANKHKNLGKFLHPRKDGRPHGSPRD